MIEQYSHDSRRRIENLSKLIHLAEKNHKEVCRTRVCRLRSGAANNSAVMVTVGTALSDGPRTDPVAEPEARTTQAPVRINPNFLTQDCFSHSSGSVQAAGNALYIIMFLQEYSHVWQFATLALKKRVFIHIKYFHFPQSDGKIDKGCGGSRR